MKKTLFFMPLLAALAFTGCSSEDVIDNEGNFDGKFDGQAYMRVRIAMSDGATSRATTQNDFVNGTAEEQAIKEIGLKFYNADGSFYGYGLPVENPTVTPTTEDFNIEGQVANAVIVLQINSNAPKPTHVVAFANCGEGWKLSPEPNISEIDQVMTGYSTTYDGTEYYAMTSSNYLVDNAGAASFVQGYQTQIDPAKFKPTEAEAKADGVPVDIYVERLAAKVKVETDVTAETVTNGDYTLDFKLDGYALGATNPTSYYVKHIDRDWKATTLWNDWNENDKHRCYWAADMNYYEKNVAPELDYVSYDEVKGTLTANKGKWLYCTENTQTSFGNEEVKTPTDVNAAPRYTSADVNRYLFQEFAYVIGHYVVKQNGQPLDGTKEENAYLFEYAGKILPYKAMLTYMQNALGNIVFTRSQNGDAAAVYTSVDMVEKGWLKIGRYENDASLVCLQLTNDAKEEELKKLYIKKQNTAGEGKDDSDYTQIASRQDVIDLLKQSTVQAYGFKYDPDCAGTGEGGYLAYFPILIKHLNTGADATWGEDSRGYYGVVRNHCYTITINSIKGLGIGIYDPTVDIIPKDKIKPLFLAAKFNVLSWRVVNQTVDL